MAKITALPIADALTGDEHLPIVQGKATKRITMASFRDLITPYLQQWYRGDRGDTGPANSTFASLASMRAAPRTNRSYILTAGRQPEIYAFVEGDFSDDGEDGIDIVQLNGVSLAQGALVRQQTGTHVSTFAIAKRIGTASMGSIVIDDRDGTRWRRWAANDLELTPDQEDVTWFEAASGTRFYLATANAYIEAFGAVGDYDYRTRTGTDNTARLQAAANYVRRRCEALRLKPGSKYLTDTIYFNYDAAKNPVYPDSRPGRAMIDGSGGGIATGSLEDAGAALVHRDNSAAPLIVVKGRFSIADPAAMGESIVFQCVNFVGGYETTDVLYLGGCQGKIELRNYSIKGYNPTGNGITEDTTWEVTHDNGVITGPAQQIAPKLPDGSPNPEYDPNKRCTGIGLNIKDDGSNGQVNMKLYRNLNIYGWGYGIRIGRRASTGTFGPLLFQGGQVSWSDFHGAWVDGGCYNITFQNWQSENNRLNGFRVDSAGATDLANQIVVQTCMFAKNGLAQDGTPDSFDINIVDGRQCVIDSCSFHDVTGGVAFDVRRALDLRISNLLMRTVSEVGQQSGANIFGYNVPRRGTRIRCDTLAIDNGARWQYNDAALECFQLAYEVYSRGVTAPDITLGFSTGSEPARSIMFDNPVEDYPAGIAVTGFIGGRPGAIMMVRTSNDNTRLIAGPNLRLRGDGAMTADRIRSFYCLNGLVWLEMG